MEKETPGAKRTFMIVAAGVFTGPFNHWQYRRLWACIVDALDVGFELARAGFGCLTRFAALLTFPISIPLLFFLVRFLQRQAQKHVKYDED